MLSFSSAPGNLFDRLGSLGGLVKELRAYQAAQLPNFIDTTDGVTAQFQAESDLAGRIGQNYVAQLNGVGATGQLAKSIAQATLNRMIYRDNPRPGQTLQQGSNVDNLVELIRQMEAAGASILALAVTATPTAFTGGGVDATVLVSTKRPDGRTQENTFSETISVLCVADSFTGGATLGRELYAIYGQGQSPNPFTFDWPSGSGCSVQVQAINGTNGGQLTNGGFDDWDTTTANVPDGWTLRTGTPGVHILEDTGNVLDPPPSSSVRLIGDGSNLTRLAQQVGLQSLTQYGMNLYLRRDGTAPAAGQLAIELTDGNGNVINDEQGVANRRTVDLTSALTTTFAGFPVAFRTPRVLPAEVWVQFRLSTALTSGRSVYLDKAGLDTMQRLYASGPWAAVFSGGAAAENNDLATVAVVNGRGAAGTLNTWQTLMASFFDEMIAFELLLPSGGSPTISDNLID